MGGGDDACSLMSRDGLISWKILEREKNETIQSVHAEDRGVCVCVGGCVYVCEIGQQ